MLQQSPLAWMVLRDSPITSFADFAGRTIGVHGDTATPSGIGSIDPERLQGSIDLLVRNGVIDTPLAAAALLW